MMDGQCMIQWKLNSDLKEENSLHGMVKAGILMKNQKKVEEEQKYGDLRDLHL